ncbi:hypothetical protein EAF00_005785 [Botryotinia globosa]|nr:hypothetical protein EAF00_005785 [Botryotinia globosa]
MRSKSKLTCGLCELDPTVSIKNSERSWANFSALLKHQHSGFHVPKLRNVYDTIQSHVTELVAIAKLQARYRNSSSNSKTQMCLVTGEQKTEQTRETSNYHNQAKTTTRGAHGSETQSTRMRLNAYFQLLRSNH